MWIWPTSGRPLALGALRRLPAAGEPLLQRRHPAPGPALLPRLPPLIGECDEILPAGRRGEARLSYHSESDHPDVIALSSLANLCHLYALLQFYHPGQGRWCCPPRCGPGCGASWGWLEGRLQQGEAELRFPAALLDLAHGQCNGPLQPLLLGSSTARCGLRPSSHYRDG
jgi:hypothetical protein